MTWTGAWPSQSLQTSRRRLVELRTTATGLLGSDEEDVSSAVSRFLVVRSAGHIEFTFDECIFSYATAKSHPDIAAYVKAGLFVGRNPSPGKLVAHLTRLSASWGTSLRSLLDEDDQALDRELSFLVDRRNKIAHGQNEGVRMTRALQLCDASLALSDWFVTTLNPLL